MSAPVPPSPPHARSLGSAGDGFDLFGHEFRFQSNVPRARDLVASLYRGFGRDHPSGVPAARLESTASGQYVWETPGQRGLASSLAGALWDLEAAVCAEMLRTQTRRVALHAAAICSADGYVLLSGQSGAGKSTLTAALAGRGFFAASDDVSLLEPETLAILPVPRPLHLDDNSARLLREDGLTLPAAWEEHQFVAPEDLGRPEEPPRRAAAIVFLAGPRSDTPVLREIPQAEMTARMLSETGQGPHTSIETIGILSRLTATVRCAVLTPGPLTATADLAAAWIARGPCLKALPALADRRKG